VAVPQCFRNIRIAVKTDDVRNEGGVEETFVGCSMLCVTSCIAVRNSCEYSIRTKKNAAMVMDVSDSRVVRCMFAPVPGRGD
jgi:hypothetical protein